MRDMKPYKSKEKRVLSSLSTNIQQPASLVDVQTMLLLKKKKPHLVSPEPPNLNLCLSRSPLLSPGNFRKQILSHYKWKGKETKKKKKQDLLTKQLPKQKLPRRVRCQLPKTQRGTCRGKLGSILAKTKQTPWLFFCFIFLLQQQKNPKYSLSLLPHLKLHLPHHLLPRTQLLFLPQRRGKLSNPMQQSSSSSPVTENVPMKFPK